MEDCASEPGTRYGRPQLRDHAPEETALTEESTTTWWTERGDLVVTLLLASVTVMLAWSGFQASKWSGVQAINFSDAGKARTDSNALTDLGGTAASIDAAVFIAWLEAAEPSLAAGDPTAAVSGEGLAPFFYENFSDRLRPAVDEWIELRRRGDADGQLPFDLDSYVVPEFVQARQLRDDASAFGDAARANNQQSDIYVLASVVFAAALFLAGICQKMRRPSSQQLVFAVSLAVTAAGLLILLTQPIEFARSDLPI